MSEKCLHKQSRLTNLQVFREAPLSPGYPDMIPQGHLSDDGNAAKLLIP